MYLIFEFLNHFFMGHSRVKRKKMATREEELQKKREEAERKARRGEIDPTHEFTFQVHMY